MASVLQSQGLENSISLPQSGYDVVGSIVTYKTELQEVQQAIRQFLAVPLRLHLCIIDNSPTALPRSCYNDPRISYYFANGNLGYGRAHNIALRASLGHTRYNLVMNTDITYSPDVVTRLVSFMDANPQAGLAGPKVLYPNGSLQHVCRLLPTPANMFLRRFLPRSPWTRRADAFYELRWWNHRCIANIPYFQGSFMLLQTQLCNRLGGFDERFGPEEAAEDNEFCYRWLRAGRPLRYEPSLVVEHHDWRSPDELERLYVRYARGEGFFYAKHLRRGDLRMLRFVIRDLAWGVRALASGLLKGREAWTDSRRGVFKGLPSGFAAGWRVYGKER